jgi:hypothetical protein
MENKNNNTQSANGKDLSKEVIIDSHTSCCRPRSIKPLSVSNDLADAHDNARIEKPESESSSRND